jgi:hypothetical protein
MTHESRSTGGQLSQGRRPGSRLDDPDRGTVFMLVFIAAILIIVGDIWLASAVGRMWILVPAMALDLLVTFAVLVLVTRLVGDDGGDEDQSTGVQHSSRHRG